MSCISFKILASAVIRSLHSIKSFLQILHLIHGLKSSVADSNSSFLTLATLSPKFQVDLSACRISVTVILCHSPHICNSQFSPGLLCCFGVKFSCTKLKTTFGISLKLVIVMKFWCTLKPLQMVNLEFKVKLLRGVRWKKDIDAGSSKDINIDSTIPNISLWFTDTNFDVEENPQYLLCKYYLNFGCQEHEAKRIKEISRKTSCWICRKIPEIFLEITSVT